jgi:hypothetical protein
MFPSLKLARSSKTLSAKHVHKSLNDRFDGTAPDIGAYEASQELPLYGPRPEGVDEETAWREKN